MSELIRREEADMAEVMMFPDTVEEFMDEYKVVDTDHVYSNGTEYVPIFRMRQWFNHIDAVEVVRCKDCKYAEIYDGYYTQICCDNGVIGGYGELWSPDDFCSYGERRQP